MNLSGPSLANASSTLSWYFYAETGILGLGSLVGIIGNALVIKTACRVETKFARQIMTLFFTLAISDGIISGVKIPLLISLKFKTPRDVLLTLRYIFFGLNAISQITLWKHFFVGFQRFMIMYSFPYYRKYFTFSTTVAIVVSLWLVLWMLNIVLPVLAGLNVTFTNIYFRHYFDRSTLEIALYEIITLGIISILPVCCTVFCHIWIVFKIVKSGLTHLENIEDSATFIRINITSVLRTMLLLVCVSPFLITKIIDPIHKSVSITGFLWTEYFFCAHSVLSPFLTLCDSDFKDSSSFKKSTQNQLRSAGSLRRSRKFAVSIITSGDMKTVKHTEWPRLRTKSREGAECTELGFESLKKYSYPSSRSCKMHEYGRHGKLGMCMFFKSKIKSKLHGGLFLNISYYVSSIYYCAVFLYLCTYVFWSAPSWSSHPVYRPDCHDETFIIYSCKRWH